jgi:hypothetical protein
MDKQPALAVSVSRVIAAPSDELYALISDVTTIGSRSPETVEARWMTGTGDAGSRFRGRNRIGALRWSTVSTVVRAEPGRAFCFEVAAPSRTTWSYVLEPVAGGTRVTEAMQKDNPQPLPIRLLQRLAGVTDREAHLREGISATLEHLEAAVLPTTPES